LSREEGEMSIESPGVRIIVRFRVSGCSTSGIAQVLAVATFHAILAVLSYRTRGIK